MMTTIQLDMDSCELLRRATVALERVAACMERQEPATFVINSRGEIRPTDEREMLEHVKVVEPDSWDRLMFDINKQVSESDAKSFIARAKRLVVDDVENDCHD